MTIDDRNKNTYKSSLIKSTIAHVCIFFCISIVPIFFHPKIRLMTMGPRLIAVNSLKKARPYGKQQTKPIDKPAVKKPAPDKPKEEKKETKKEEKKPDDTKKKITEKQKKPDDKKKPAPDKKEKKPEKKEKTVAQKDTKKPPKKEKEPAYDFKEPEQTLADSIRKKIDTIKKPTKDTPAGVPDGFNLSGMTNASLNITDADFPFAWYVAILYNKVDNNWVELPSSDTGNYACWISFTIAKNGEIKDAAIAKNSGHAGFDSSCLEAVKRSNPLPPLPNQYPKDMLKVCIQFDRNQKQED